MSEFVYSTILGTSDAAMERIARLYIPEGSLIADLTFNKGVFWREMDLTRHGLVASDLAPFDGISIQCDLRRTPYRNETFDVVVLDPPYANASTKPRRDGVSQSYNLELCMTPKEIKRLYADGIKEAERIMKPGGTLIVKCQPFVDGGKQHWIDIDIFNDARFLGMVAWDRFTMVPPGDPIIRHPDRPQQHSRKLGSFFWIFKKRAARRPRAIKQRSTGAAQL